MLEQQINSRKHHDSTLQLWSRAVAFIPGAKMNAHAMPQLNTTCTELLLFVQRRRVYFTQIRAFVLEKLAGFLQNFCYRQEAFVE